MGNKVKVLTSDMTGAPSLNTTLGTPMAFMDAVLVNGFNTKSVTSLIIASNIGTATLAAGHGYVVDQIVTFMGATPASLNNEFKVTAVSSTTIQFNAPGITDQTATGTVTVKTSGLGFDKVFSGTNKAAYRSPNVLSNRPFLRVEFSAATWYNFSVRAYETMSDVDSGTNPVPSASQISATGYASWPISNTINSSNNRWWMIIGDDRTFYYLIDTNTTGIVYSNKYQSYWFGDFNSIKTSDAYNWGIGVSHSPVTLNISQSGTYMVMPGYFASSSTFTSSYLNDFIARSSDLISTSVRIHGQYGTSTYNGYTAGVRDFISVLSGELYIRDIVFCEIDSSTNTWVLRGKMRGSFYTVGCSYPPNGIFSLQGRNNDSSKKTLILSGGSTYGAIPFDVSELW